MKRKIVNIDQEKCNGCGQCVTACAEGAIELVGGKARLVSETYCDGLGACLGECPQDAITVEERDAPEFDEKAVKEHLVTRRRPEHRHECPGSAARSFAQAAPARQACPGSALRAFGAKAAATGEESGEAAASLLGHWPVQLMLVPPTAPFLKGADLLVCADCVAFALPDFHRRYLGGRVVLVGCPKLDDIEFYREKLAEIFAEARPASLTILRMEVPCCAALANAAVEARDKALPKLPTEVHIIGIRGSIVRKVLDPADKASV